MNMLQKGIAVACGITAISWSAFAGDEAGLRTANEGQIRDQWMLVDGVKLAPPGYPQAYAERGDDMCMAVGYVIKEDGTVGDFTVLKSWTSSTGEKEPVAGYWEAFAKASADALSQWKFKPRPEVRRPVPTQTVATLHFMGKGTNEPLAVREHCKIGDLAAYLQEVNDLSEGKDGINRNRLDKVYQDRQRAMIRQKVSGTALSMP